MDVAPFKNYHKAEGYIPSAFYPLLNDFFLKMSSEIA
jgi:hypothetical protein